MFDRGVGGKVDGEKGDWRSILSLPPLQELEATYQHQSHVRQKGLDVELTAG